MSYKGNLTLKWYNKHKPLVLTPTGDPKDHPAILDWVNKDGALFYEIDETANRGLRPEWTDASDFRVKESRPLVLQCRYEVKDGKITESDEPKTDDNILIRGDNLLALNTLVSHMESLPEDEKVKCIYIDPPYNTGSAFDKYDDNLEHSQWLTMMRDRLVLMRKLLREDGVIFISCDDDEQAYLKIMCDEIFGRQNFINCVIWQKKFSPQNDAKWFSDNHDFILVYTKDKMLWRPNLLARSEEALARYKNPDNDPRGVWTSSDLTVKRITEKDIYEITTPNGNTYFPTKGRSWGTSKEKFLELVADNRIWFGENGGNMPRVKKFLTEVKDGITPMTIFFDDNYELEDHLWLRTEVGDTQESKQELKDIFNGDSPFDTPKPERLLEKILYIATQEGDIVFDAFGGSGTTFAVAHKMNRRYIGIEVGEHADTLIIPRLKKVLTATDGVGLTKSGEWQGGGSFSYYHLGDSVLVKNDDESYSFNPDMPLEELCRGILRYFDSPMSAYENGWAYGHNGENGYLVCLEDNDGDLTAEEIENARVKFCPSEKPYLATIFCLSASDDDLNKLLLGTYTLPYKLQGE